MELLGYVATIFVGVVLGSIGAGGSILAIPILIYLFSLDVETATAYSLFIVGSTSLTGVLVRPKLKIASFYTALWFGVPSMMGTFVSRKWIIVSIPDVLCRFESLLLRKEHMLLVLLCLLMITSSLMLILKQDMNFHAFKKTRPLHLISLGFLVGLIVGLVGAGGGFLIIPAMIIFARQSLSVATLTSLLIIASNALLGFCGDLINRQINWQLLLSITSLSVAGFFLGSWLSRRIHQKNLVQRGFAWFTMTVALVMLGAMIT